MYRQSEKHALLTVLCSLFLSGQMQAYWCPLWWLFVWASDNKVVSSFLMRSPGLHLWIFKEKIPGEKYHGRFLSYAFTSCLLLLKYLSRCISTITKSKSKTISLEVPPAFAWLRPSQTKWQADVPKINKHNCKLFVLESFHASLSLSSSSTESQNNTAEKLSLSGCFQLSSPCFFKQNTEVETLISKLKAPHRQGILTFATVFVIFAHWSSDWWLQRRERAF